MRPPRIECGCGDIKLAEQFCGRCSECVDCCVSSGACDYIPLLYLVRSWERAERVAVALVAGLIGLVVGAAL